MNRDKLRTFWARSARVALGTGAALAMCVGVVFVQSRLKPAVLGARSFTGEQEARSALRALALCLDGWQMIHGTYPVFDKPMDPWGAACGAFGGKPAEVPNDYDFSLVSDKDRWAAVAVRKTPVDGRYPVIRMNQNRWMCEPFGTDSAFPAKLSLSPDEPRTPGTCPQVSDGTGGFIVRLSPGDAPLPKATDVKR